MMMFGHSTLLATALLLAQTATATADSSPEQRAPEQRSALIAAPEGASERQRMREERRARLKAQKDARDADGEKARALLEQQEADAPMNRSRAQAVGLSPSASSTGAFVVAPPASPLVVAQAGGDKKDITTTKVDLSSCKPANGKISFNFEKATINEVLDQISRLRCMNFILSDAVKGKNDMTIVSRSPVTVQQAYAAFLSALEANGMALVPAGPFWKVVERKEASKMTLPLYEIGKDGVLTKVTPKESRVGEFPNSDAHVTLLYDIKYANKEQVQAVVRNLMSKNGDLQTPGGSMFILTDSGSNILRILEVLDKIDVEGTSNQLNVVSLDYADVGSISSKLQEIFGVGDKSKAAAAGAPKVRTPPKTPEEKGAGDVSGGDEGGELTDVVIEKIIADERTNQLLIICSPRAFEQVKSVLKILDVPATDGGGGVRMWVVPLANADAQKAASTLSSLAQGAGANKGATDPKAAGAKAKEAAKTAALFEGDVKVTADETTNSLVVVASARDFRALRQVVDQLDQRRPQVFVEAAILEIALNQNRNVGLSAYGSAPVDVPVPGAEGTGIATFANEGGKSLFGSGAKVASGIALLQALEGRFDATSAATGLSLVDELSNSIGLFSFTGPAITLIKDSSGKPIVSFPSVGAVLNLLQGNSNVDILSTPHIMTTDNEKAEISVGDRVPVVRGFQPSGAAGSLGFGGLQNVSSEDVKLKLSVTPHVNADNEVRVEIEQEVSDISGQVAIPNAGTQPIISTRSVKSTVVTGDQRTVVIGGLMQDKKSDTESKVPFFGDIPIIGWLFKNWSDTSKKTNLVLLLTPYIVRDEEDFRKIYDVKMKERQAFIDAYFTDARRYDPYVDYQKKNGPLGTLLRAVDHEMKCVENGGTGCDGEELIGPANFGPRAVGGGDGNDGDGTPEQPSQAPVLEAPPAPAPAELTPVLPQ